MTRDEFLESHWSPYPAKPDDALHWGRLVLEPRGAELTLARGGKAETAMVAGDTTVLRPGDWIAVRPEGEFVLLAPARREPALSSFDPCTVHHWSEFRAAVRRFFVGHDFQEVTTPGLVVCPGTEPSLDVFATEFMEGSRRRRMYLPTSPELHLKKALALGFERPFEIKTCYRNGEITSHHQPEFTLLEWYRAGEGPEAIREDALRLISFLAESFPKRDLRRPVGVRRVTMASLFFDVLGAEIRPESDFEDYRRIALDAGLAPRPGSSIDDVFFLIFGEKIEPTFDLDTLMIVEDWPPFQAALARLTPEGWGDRFEIYWRGLELANAFHELNDPDVQRRRFEEDLRKKKEWGREAIPLDEDFLRTLESGMPPAAGIALGVERLYMAMFGVTDIAALKVFPYR